MSSDFSWFEPWYFSEQREHNNLKEINPTIFDENFRYRTVLLAFDKYDKIKKGKGGLEYNEWILSSMPHNELAQCKMISPLNQKELKWVKGQSTIPLPIVYDYKGKGLFLLYGEEVLYYCATNKITDIRIMIMKLFPDDYNKVNKT